MKNKFSKILGPLSLLLLSQWTLAQQPYEFALNTKKIGAPIQSTMYGLFFEDINFGADGGLYGELVKNRSFDFPQSLLGWYTFGEVSVNDVNSPFVNNPNYLILSGAKHPHKQTGIENEGYRGMGFKKNATYNFSVWAKKISGDGEQKIRIELIGTKNDIIGSKELSINSDKWEKYELGITSKSTDAKGRLRVFFTTKGSIAIDHVSLFPQDTYKGRKNGLRKDLAEALADIKPGVFRFPGGCIVEGTDIEDRYYWKKSVGTVENRPLNLNRWQYTFSDRFFPDYYQSYGLGFYEYFLLAEDMGAEPLPVVFCGLVCQYQNDGEHCHIPVGNLDSYVQDALDLIEFANGPVTSTWGKVRAEMGHPESFNLKYIGVGNEQWGKEYIERLEPFVKAIRKSYPDIQIIGSSGPSADGKEFDYLWPEMKRLNVDLVDEHYYKEPNWFYTNANRYDNYDRKGPAVFAGEYASHDYETGKENNFLSALSEASFMTGLERNADIVHMCTYAPLLAHVDAWQWKPDMIWFDNLDMVKTSNYYVQQMYAQNKGSNVINLTWKSSKKPIAGEENLYASAVYNKDENCYIVKVTNTSTQTKEIQITLEGANKKSNFVLGDCLTIQDNNLKNRNTIEAPLNITPKKTTANISGNIFRANTQPQSFNVYKIQL